MVARQVEFAKKELMENFLVVLTTRFIPELKETLTIPDIPERRKKIVSYSLHRTNIKIMFLMYTLGYDRESIRTELVDLIEYSKNYFSLEGVEISDLFDSYAYTAYLLCFCVMLGESPKEVLSLLKPFYEKDQLLARLAASFDRDNSIIPPLKQMFPVFSKPLVEMLPMVDAEEISEHANKYLDGYFVAAKKLDATYYNTHKEQDQNYFVHMGYWAFELAALVVIMNWDDSAFRDHPIYPKDMVDWARANKASN